MFEIISEIYIHIRMSGGMSLSKTDATFYLTQLGRSDKGRSIKGLNVLSAN